MNVALVLTLFFILFISNIDSSCILNLDLDNNNQVNEYIALGNSISFHCCAGDKWFFNSSNSGQKEEILPSDSTSSPRYTYRHNSSVWLYITKMESSMAGTYFCEDEKQEKSAQLNIAVNTSQVEHMKQDFQVIEDQRNGFLVCPKSSEEEVLLWKWRYLDRNTTKEELKIAKRDGDFGEFRIFNKKTNVKILNYENLGAKKVIWCQVKVAASNETKFYEISWKVYKADRPEIYSLKWTSLPIKETFLPTDYDSINYILEGKAFRLVCHLKKTSDRVDIVSVEWKVNNATVLRPPNEIDNANLKMDQTSQLTGSNYHRTMFNNQSFTDAIECSMRIRLVSDVDNSTEKVVETSITKSFDIIVEPKINKFDADPAGYEEGKEVILECAFDANGQYTAKIEFSPSRSEIETKDKWTELLKTSNNDYVVTTTASGLVVTFKSIRKTYHGTYRCIVENESKKVSKKTDLKVISKADVELSSEFKNNYFYRNNKPIQATCRVFGYPLINETKPLSLIITCDQRRLSFNSKENQKVIEEITYTKDQLKGIKAQYSIQPEKLQGTCEVTCHYQDDQKASIHIKEAKPPSEMNYMQHICSSSRGMVFLFDKTLLPEEMSPRNNITIIVGNYKPDDVVDGSKEKYSKLDIKNLSPISLSELKPNTSYLFEWSFKNDLGLSSFQAMKVSTLPEGPPPAPREIYLFDKKSQSENTLTIGVKMTDECPYIGGREELDDFIVKFPKIDEKSEITDAWTDNKICKLTTSTKEKTDWSGDRFIICIVDLPPRIDSTNVKISSRNRFGISSWQDKKLVMAPAHVKSVQANSANSQRHTFILDTIVAIMLIVITIRE